MPLRAVIDGEDKVAPLLDDVEWEALKGAVVRKEKSVVMPCCNAAGRLRVSKLGTKHFYHNRTAECDWKPETAEHLRAKTEILMACRQAGYQAIPEKVGLGWRADVYAEKGKAKLAFEVQWSRQTLEGTQERQARYERDGITCCWFFRRLSYDFKPLKANNQLPIFILSGGQSSDEPFCVNAPGFHSPNKNSLPLQDFVVALLKRKIRYRSLMTPYHLQHIKVVFIPHRCWKCKRLSHIFYVEKPYKSRCGKQMQERQTSLPGGGAEEVHYEFRPEVISAVQHFSEANPNITLKMGAVKMRSSKTDGRSYMSFGCQHCDALFGNVFLYHETFPEARTYGISYASFEAELAVEEFFSESQHHWCYPADGCFCDAPQQV